MFLPCSLQVHSINLHGLEIKKYPFQGYYHKQASWYPSLGSQLLEERKEMQVLHADLVAPRVLYCGVM